MATVRMELTRALAVLKQIDAAIKNYFTNQVLVLGISRGTADNPRASAHPTFSSVADVSAHIQSNIDTLQNLRKRQFEIKRKIIASNAVTTVEIDGQPVTVAEAIFMKSLLESRKEVLGKLRSSANVTVNAFNEIRRKVDEQTTQLQTNLNAVKSEDIDVLNLRKSELETHLKINAAEFIDPKKIHELIAREEKAIADMETNLDYTLSLSNTRTFIDVEE